MTAIDVFSKNPRLTWTTERVDMLRNCVTAGLSCRQIADEIGVSRNAVIGKLNRLGLSRGRSPAAPRSRGAPPVRRPQVLTQRLALKALFSSEPIGGNVVSNVVSVEPCSLLNLAPHRCRWPIGAAADFTFCGNIAADGVSYCAGHARIAYRLSPQRAHAVGRSR